MCEPSSAVVAKSLTKRYGTTTAVNELDLSIEHGDIYGFLGPNGAGKTTTMRIFTGLIEPSGGEARVAGVPCVDRRALVEHIGLMPETPPLYDQLTGREQLQFAADLRNVPWDAVVDTALSLCASLGLRADLDRRIDGYSKGMRQKLSFIQSVQHDPAVVFLDEPTSGLDPRAAKTLRELITDLADGDTTVLISTHILPVVEDIADMVGVLHDGQLAAEGSLAELRSAAERTEGDGADLEDAFLALTTDGDTAWV
ncbi:ABC transporter ATP-binding protein [Haloarcula argentinensis]|uniref:Multidrug ABC transporter ATP-binding protein n=1 Tax=Haloarcula argentinensis TaxID=43776 RepID=A0A830FM94_HALAR|nr:ABC transporter ATP-binding protein [Haloarcula argentinensis]GGM38367.1 multidrug ABC transporter ATP-binding protein [Haloarcula argentinensis]